MRPSTAGSDREAQLQKASSSVRRTPLATRGLEANARTLHVSGTVSGPLSPASPRLLNAVIHRSLHDGRESASSDVIFGDPAFTMDDLITKLDEDELPPTIRSIYTKGLVRQGSVGRFSSVPDFSAPGAGFPAPEGESSQLLDQVGAGGRLSRRSVQTGALSLSGEVPFVSTDREDALSPPLRRPTVSQEFTTLGRRASQQLRGYDDNLHSPGGSRRSSGVNTVLHDRVSPGVGSSPLGLWDSAHPQTSEFMDLLHALKAKMELLEARVCNGNIEVVGKKLVNLDQRLDYMVKQLGEMTYLVQDHTKSLGTMRKVQAEMLRQTLQDKTYVVAAPGSHPGSNSNNPQDVEQLKEMLRMVEARNEEIQEEMVESDTQLSVLNQHLGTLDAGVEHAKHLASSAASAIAKVEVEQERLEATVGSCESSVKDLTSKIQALEDLVAHSGLGVPSSTPAVAVNSVRGVRGVQRPPSPLAPQHISPHTSPPSSPQRVQEDCGNENIQRMLQEQLSQLNQLANDQLLLQSQVIDLEKRFLECVSVDGDAHPPHSPESGQRPRSARKVGFTVENDDSDKQKLLAVKSLESKVSYLITKLANLEEQVRPVSATRRRVGIALEAPDGQELSSPAATDDRDVRLPSPSGAAVSARISALEMMHQQLNSNIYEVKEQVRQYDSRMVAVQSAVKVVESLQPELHNLQEMAENFCGVTVRLEAMEKQLKDIPAIVQRLEKHVSAH